MRIRINDKTNYAGIKPAVGKMIEVEHTESVFNGQTLYYVSRSTLMALGCRVALAEGFDYAFSQHECEEVNELAEMWHGVKKGFRKLHDFMCSDKFGFALVVFLVGYLVIFGFRFQWKALLGWWIV